MSLIVRLPSPLRPHAGGAATLTLDAATLADLTREISARYPALATRILRDGTFGPFVNVFVDGEDARFLDPAVDLRAARVVEILPAMSGGAMPGAPERDRPRAFRLASGAPSLEGVDEGARRPRRARDRVVHSGQVELVV